ncbi:MAG: DUF1508 domain-containing protein [Thermoplasmatales archaeon]|nr:DUF1508 domain-containing protein [Thermoplasmatales archaeon]
MANPKFELFKDSAGKYRFRLIAPNGEIIAVGEAYESKKGCRNGIESVKRNVGKADVIDLSRTRNIDLEIKKSVDESIRKSIDQKIKEADFPWIIGLAFGAFILIFAFGILMAVQYGLITL